jgi:NTP pyrophosphatase (non-canonical NTP hydrolase)
MSHEFMAMVEDMESRSIDKNQGFPPDKEHPLAAYVKGQGKEQDITYAMYSKLSPAQIERLVWLAEECSEVVKAVMKILRHGYENQANSNKFGLEEEIGDVLAAIDILISESDVSSGNIDLLTQARLTEFRSGKCFMHHQKG